jgi:hypothetical protein
LISPGERLIDFRGSGLQTEYNSNLHTFTFRLQKNRITGKKEYSPQQKGDLPLKYNKGLFPAIYL